VQRDFGEQELSNALMVWITSVLEATSTRHFGGTQLPTAATSGAGSDSRTDTASTNRADRSQAPHISSLSALEAKL
jgi:hypothetical protein